MGNSTVLLQAELSRYGFVPGFDEVVVERSLDPPLPDPVIGLRLVPAPAPPADLLAAILPGSSHPQLHTGKLPGILSHPGGEHPGPRPMAHWRLALAGEDTVGIVSLFAPPPGEHAGIFFLGVLPEWRRKGAGRSLHALALRELAAMGHRRYRDTTDHSNLAMQRVFFWNGCRFAGVVRNLRFPRARTSA